MFKIKLKTKNGNAIGHKKIVNIYISISISLFTVYYTYYIIGDSILNDNKIYTLKDPYKNKEEAISRVVYNAIHFYLKYLKENNLTKPDILIINHDEPEIKTLWSIGYLSGHKKVKNENVSDYLDTLEYNNIYTKFMLIYPKSDINKYYKSIKIHESLKLKIDKVIENENQELHG